MVGQKIRLVSDPLPAHLDPVDFRVVVVLTPSPTSTVFYNLKVPSVNFKEFINSYS